MKTFRSLPRLALSGALVLAGALGAGWPPTAHAAANPELDRMIAKLPDPSKFKESPLQGALDPATHDPDLKRVVSALRGGDARGALKLMRTLSERYPDHPAIQFLYGELALKLKAYPEAEKAFRTVAANPKTASFGWYRLARAQYIEDRPRDAAASMRRCLAAKPPESALPQVWFVTAYYNTLSGQHAEAIKAAQQATKLEPGNTLMWTVRGYCESSAKQYNAAIADYQKAVSLNRRNAVAYEGLGIAYVQVNRPADAVAPLKAALDLTPRNYLAATELGFCYLRSNQPDEGVRWCRRAVSYRPEFSKGWDVLGLCYLRLGKKREAVDSFERALRAAPGNTAARAHLEQARRAGGTRA